MAVESTDHDYGSVDHGQSLSESHAKIGLRGSVAVCVHFPLL